MKRSACPWCWACGERAPLRLCEFCDAPPWAGTVVGNPVDSAGVYLIAAACGLWKIGLSNRSVAARTDDLIRQARGRGEAVGFRGCLPGADWAVEQWLHAVLAGSRDRSWALAERLPNHTEWFWPTPALDALLANEFVVYSLEPEFWAPPELNFARVLATDTGEAA